MHAGMRYLLLGGFFVYFGLVEIFRSRFWGCHTGEMVIIGIGIVLVYIGIKKYFGSSQQ